MLDVARFGARSHLQANERVAFTQVDFGLQLFASIFDQAHDMESNPRLLSSLDSGTVAR